MGRSQPPKTGIVAEPKTDGIGGFSPNFAQNQMSNDVNLSKKQNQSRGRSKDWFRKYGEITPFGARFIKKSESNGSKTDGFSGNIRGSGAGTQGRTRTGTPAKAGDFESPASTIPPLGHRERWSIFCRRPRPDGKRAAFALCAPPPAAYNRAEPDRPQGRPATAARRPRARDRAQPRQGPRHSPGAPGKTQATGRTVR